MQNFSTEHLRNGVDNMYRDKSKVKTKSQYQILIAPWKHHNTRLLGNQRCRLNSLCPPPFLLFSSAGCTECAEFGVTSIC